MSILEEIRRRKHMLQHGDLGNDTIVTDTTIVSLEGQAIATVLWEHTQKLIAEQMRAAATSDTRYDPE